MKNEPEPTTSTHRPEPSVHFPQVSQILDSRRTLVQLLRDTLSNANSGKHEVLLVSGASKTSGYARIYQTVFEEEWGVIPRHEVLSEAPSEKEARLLATKILTYEKMPSLVIYVGGQTVADSTKYIVKRLHREGHKVAFGGIITTLSNDGVFSDNASLISDAGLPISGRQVAPDFVVGHKLTLLRQPYDMKLSCVGDLLSNASSLWDYEYSCRVLSRYHNDFAADLARSAFEWLLPRHPEDTPIGSSFLHDPESIKALYRAIQLCGLSMQLLQASDTCSGSEHVGQKWLDEYTRHYNRRVDPSKNLKSLNHGAGVAVMTVITLYMQGQAELAEKVKTILDGIALPYKTADLRISPRVLQICLALGMGYRCPRFLVYLTKGGVPLPRGLESERLTVLDEIEETALADAIKNAMIDSEVVGRPETFERLSGDEQSAMKMVLDSCCRNIQKRVAKEFNEQTADEVSKHVKQRHAKNFTELE